MGFGLLIICFIGSLKLHLHFLVNSSSDAPVIGSWNRVKKNELGQGSKKFHYAWVFDEGETGFIVHKKNRKKYKMFHDSNDNGILDKEDVLISKGKFADDFRGIKPGKLLSKKADGLITAKPYKLDCDHGHDHDHDHDHEVCGVATGINSLGHQHLSLLNAEDAMVVHDHGDAHNHDHAMM